MLGPRQNQPLSKSQSLLVHALDNDNGYKFHSRNPLALTRRDTNNSEGPFHGKARYHAPST